MEEAAKAKPKAFEWTHGGRAASTAHTASRGEAGREGEGRGGGRWDAIIHPPRGLTFSCDIR